MNKTKTLKGRAATIAAATIIVVAGGGTGAYASGLVGDGDVQPNSMDSSEIQNESLTSQDVDNGTIRSEDIRNGDLGVQSIDIKDASIQPRDIDPGYAAEVGAIVRTQLEHEGVPVVFSAAETEELSSQTQVLEGQTGVWQVNLTVSLEQPGTVFVSADASNPIGSCTVAEAGGSCQLSHVFGLAPQAQGLWLLTDGQTGTVTHSGLKVG